MLTRAEKGKVRMSVCVTYILYVHAHAAEVIGSGRQENERQHLFPSVHLLVMMVIKLELERTSGTPLTLSPGLFLSLMHTQTHSSPVQMCSFAFVLFINIIYKILIWWRQKLHLSQMCIDWFSLDQKLKE